MQSKADKIRTLTKMVKSGTITEEEFERKKARILQKKEVETSKRRISDGKVKKFVNKLKESYEDAKAAEAEKRAERIRIAKEKEAQERAKVKKILAGDIQPIDAGFSLNKDEVCYFSIQSKRYAIIDRIEERMITKTKKKGVIGRAVVGGVLLGPLGALGGAATAGSKGKTEVIRKEVSETKQLDKGTLYFTNKRFLFRGKSVVSLSHEDIDYISFPTVRKINIQYNGAEKDEHYILIGPEAKYASRYYRGITSKQE